MASTAFLRPGSVVVDDRVPGKIGRVLVVIDWLWVRIHWEHLRTQCAKFFIRDERADTLSLIKE